MVDEDGDGHDATVDCDDADPAVFPGATEGCDGIDNDCDALTDDADPDVDLSSAPPVHADADGDGFGSAVEVAAQACVPPAGFVHDATDCDDTRADISPAAAELCDGLDNDCDDGTPDGGLAFVDTQGVWSDQTAAFAAGDASTPVSVALVNDGTLHVCAGTWYAGVEIGADVDIVGPGSALATLDGGGVGLGVRVAEGQVADVSGLTISNFAKYGGIGDFGWASALSCDDDSVVTASDLVFTGNTGDYGGAISVLGGCDLSLIDSRLEANEAAQGGHLYVEGSASVQGVAFVDGVGGSGGAAFLGIINSLPGPSPSLVCTDCTFDGNETNGGTYGSGGAVWVNPDSTFTMVGGAFTTNTSQGVGGAVVLAYHPVLSSSASFSNTAFDGNRDVLGTNDIVTGANLARFDYTGTTQTVVCNPVGCQ